MEKEMVSKRFKDSYSHDNFYKRLLDLYSRAQWETAQTLVNRKNSRPLSLLLLLLLQISLLVDTNPW